jgi:H+/Cl- antiporter ClcA
MNKKLKYFFLSIIFSLIIFLLLGIPTGLIPTNFFNRMLAPEMLDYILLGLTSVLAGAYIAYSFYLKSLSEAKSDYAALGGTIAGILAFACPICNALLVAIFGSTALLVFFEPYRHYFGLLTILLFVLAFYFKIKCRKC